jgi:hypothetical protein
LKAARVYRSRVLRGGVGEGSVAGGIGLDVEKSGKIDGYGERRFFLVFFGSRYVKAYKNLINLKTHRQ